MNQQNKTERWVEEFDKTFRCDYECRSENEVGEKCSCQMKLVKDFIRTLLEEAKAEERRRCLEDCKKVIREAKVESELRYLTDSGFWGKKYLIDRDQAISAISNKTKDL